MARRLFLSMVASVSLDIVGALNILDTYGLPKLDPSITAWFKSEDASAQWKNSGGAGGFDGGFVTVGGRRLQGGTVTVGQEPGDGTNGANRPLKYLSGSSTSKYDFGKILYESFTVCAVYRYTGTTFQERILTADPNEVNWLHGAHRDYYSPMYWATAWVYKGGPKSSFPGGSFPTTWQVLCGRNAPALGLFASSSTQGTAQSPYQLTACAGGCHVQVNTVAGYAGNEFSDWAIAELMVWNRTLDDEDFSAVQGYLENKLGLFTTSTTTTTTKTSTTTTAPCDATVPCDTTVPCEDKDSPSRLFEVAALRNVGVEHVVTVSSAAFMVMAAAVAALILRRRSTAAGTEIEALL